MLSHGKRTRPFVIAVFTAAMVLLGTMAYTSTGNATGLDDLEDPPANCFSIPTATPSTIIENVGYTLAGETICLQVELEVTTNMNKPVLTVKEVLVSDGGAKPDVAPVVTTQPGIYKVTITFGTAVRTCDGRYEKSFLLFKKATLHNKSVININGSMSVWAAELPDKPFKFTADENFYVSTTCTRP